MKTAAKVFLYIKYVIYVILGLMCYIFLKSVFLFLLTCFFILLGGIAETKLKKAKSKKELLVIGIFTLLFFDLLTGIFMLCITDDELSEENTKSESDNKPTPTPKKIEDATAKIKDAENLFKSGIITEEEYQTIRTNAINQHFS